MKHLKKQRKQKKLKAYFKKDKSISNQKERKTRPIPKNFQGFSLSRCHFVSRVGKHCYMPPKYYGSNFNPTNREEFNEEMFCTNCFLSPCIMDIHGDSMRKEMLSFSKKQDEQVKSGELVATEEQQRDDIKLHLLQEMSKEFGNIFTKTYARKGIPNCVSQSLDELVFPSKVMVDGWDETALLQKGEEKEAGLEIDPRMDPGFSDDAEEEEFSWEPESQQMKSLEDLRKNDQEFLLAKERLRAFNLWIRETLEDLSRSEAWIRQNPSRS